MAVEARALHGDFLFGDEFFKVAPQLLAGVLSGPSFAQEVAGGRPTALVAASPHAQVRQALVEAFQRMTTASYASQFAGYSGQQFTVEPKATPRNADVIVHSRLVPGNGDPVTFNYLMRGSGADWKIEDVYLDGTISQLAVRRSEFSAILASDGPDGLLAKLKAQSDGLLRS